MSQKAETSRLNSFWDWFVIVLLAICIGLLVYRVGFKDYRHQALERAEGELDLHINSARSVFEQFRPLPALFANDLAFGGGFDSNELQILVQTQLQSYEIISGAASLTIIGFDGYVISRSNDAEGLEFSADLIARTKDGALGRQLVWRAGEPRFVYGFPVKDKNKNYFAAILVEFDLSKIANDIGNSIYPFILTNNVGSFIMGARGAFEDKNLLQEDVNYPKIAGSQFIDIRQKIDNNTYIFSKSLGPEPLTMKMLVDLRPARRRALSGALVAATIAGLIGGVAKLLRSQEKLSRLLYEDTLNEAERLEAKVDARTKELRAEINERKLAEENLKRTQGELIQAGKMAALGQMSAQLSHEYNQPLAAIRAYAENATAFLKQGRIEEAQKNLSRVSILTERMAKLSEHLTRFSRKSEPELHAVNLAEVIDETLDLMKGRMERRGTIIRKEYENGIWALGGEVRFQHIFLNLFSNALDAVPESRTPKLTVKIEANSGAVLVRIKDNGTGIPEELQSLVFDPFVSSKSGDKETESGLGLGLSIVYNIVQDFGGEIALVKSSPKGSEFLLKLRAAKQV